MKNDLDSDQKDSDQYFLNIVVRSIRDILWICNFGAFTFY